ncbi:hypothetical protein D3C81_1712260 [compost metagenome]
MLLVPVGAIAGDQQLAGKETGEEWNAQVDEYRFGDRQETGFDHTAFQSEQGRQQTEEDPGVHAEEQDLKDAVECHQAGHVLAVTASDLVPYQHHGYAARQPNENQASHVLRFVG